MNLRLRSTVTASRILNDTFDDDQTSALADCKVQGALAAAAVQCTRAQVRGRTLRAGDAATTVAGTVVT